MRAPRADGVAVRLCAHQPQSDAAIAGELVVAVEVRGPVVGGDEYIEIAIVVEIAEGRAAAHLGTREVRPGLRGYVVKPLASAVEE